MSDLIQQIQGGMLLAAVSVLTGAAGGDAAEPTIAGHTVKLDSQGKIIPWHSPADVGGFLGGAEAEPVRPPLTEGEPSPGKFVRQQSPDFRGSGVYHGLYLPTRWRQFPDQTYKASVIPVNRPALFMLT